MKWKIGDVTVTRIAEFETVGGTKFILPQAAPDEIREIPWLIPRYATAEGKLRMSIHALAVETPSRRIIVDTCIGNDKQGRHVSLWNNLNTPFLFKLAEAGFAPETIDTVFCTHMHVDHVGWNTRLVAGQWVPTFPKARYLFGRTEYDFWKDNEEISEQKAVIADSVNPIIGAGLAEFIPGEHQIADEISTMPTPGHTPGHLSVRIRSRGEDALLLGDVAHHPCQMAHLDWSSTIDSDPLQSARTRETVFGALAGTKTLVIGGHFDPGYVVRDGNAFRLSEKPQK